MGTEILYSIYATGILYASFIPVISKLEPNEKIMFGFGRSKLQPNILVYSLTGAAEGNVKASPIGLMPRFSDAYENWSLERHRPKRYFSDTVLAGFWD